MDNKRKRFKAYNKQRDDAFKQWCDDGYKSQYPPRYTPMPDDPNVEKDTEPDSLSERFYCIHRGKGKSCISGYLHEESKK
ncbi:hypothetical protein [Cycloclasticus pugetii]|uniref:hypothetical protein n=1 Tax=Cycloclasticus pugetii TaxID=34068 RepID=UPI00091E3978|nr:hypothetical protein [Cycloclasticus pugetii]SHI89145.1 hypothetical protein SAMN05519226_1036 [Cycloclasticus pugetii]